MSQVQKKLKISELSQDEEFFKDLDVPETPSEGPFSQDFPQMFQEILDNLKGLMPPKKAEDEIDKNSGDFVFGIIYASYITKFVETGKQHLLFGQPLNESPIFDEIEMFVDRMAEVFTLPQLDVGYWKALEVQSENNSKGASPFFPVMFGEAMRVRRLNEGLDDTELGEYTAESFEASSKWAGWCPKCRKWRTKQMSYAPSRYDIRDGVPTGVMLCARKVRRDGYWKDMDGRPQRCDTPLSKKEGGGGGDVPYIPPPFNPNAIHLAESFEAEDWKDIDWESHYPTEDPSPFESVEWETISSPPSLIKHLMEKLEKSGYICLVVGGAVRDLLLGLEPKDYDLATDATPDEVKSVVDKLENYQYITGPQAEQAKRALTSLILTPDGEVVEITTFRAELGYEDGNRAKPIAIPAKTFEEDASRRDFTINAMGMTKEGVLIDPMNGKEDLENGIIRTVGNPTDRFTEDPLRMIRGIRFAVRFGLPIEPATYQAIVENVGLVSSLSSRRLRDEIGKVLVEPNGFKILMETGVLPTLMPEFRNMKDYHHKLDYHPEDTLYNHYIEAFKKYATIENRSELGAWALLFHDIAKPQTAIWSEEGGYHTFYGHDKQGAQLVLDNYNNEVGPFEFSKKELQAIAWTTDNHLGKFWDMKKPMKVSAMRNDDRFPLLVEVVTGDTMGIRRGGDEQLALRIQEIDAITKKINEQKAKTGNKPPGFALRVFEELNVPKGKERGVIMGKIEEMVSTGQISSYEEAIEVLKTKRNA